MRFFLNGTRHKVEVIGEEVELPNAAGEKFAVHHAAIAAVGEPIDDRKNFAVSHIETGFRAASGDSIDEAIDNARRIFTEKGEEKIKAAIARAKQIIAELEVVQS